MDSAVEMKDELVSIYRERHMYPELSFEEYETMDYIEKYLTELGLEVVRGPEGAGLWAVLEGGREGKSVGIRADIDALPVAEETGLAHCSLNGGLMHACGHDSHTTMLLGAAKLLCQNKDKVRGRVKFIFQQAEELVSGAEKMIDAGVLDDIDEIIGLHVVPTQVAGSIETRTGAALASSDMFEIKVFGKGGHGSSPHACIDPIIVMANIITAIQSIANKKIHALQPVVINVCHINAGSRYNVIPDEGYMSGTIRTHDKAVREEIMQQIQTIADGMCKAYGTTYEFANVLSVPPTINDPCVTNKLIERSKKILKEENVIVMDKPYMFSEDFSCFGDIVPACMFLLGTYNEAKGCVHPLHSSKYKIDEDILPIGAAVFANYCIEE
jgi:amidohydrolase